MIGSPWVAFAIAAAGISLVMAALWGLQVRSGDASHVDVAWAYGIGVAGMLFAVVADGGAAHRALLGVLAAAWSGRLGTYILVNRVLGKEEDGRYRALREKWGERADRRFFVFFQAQAFFVVVFSVPLVLAAYDPSRSLGALEIAGAALCVAGVAGEAAADRELAAWRRDPANRGRTCRAGLWRLSRHPNYFFEWLTWVGFAVTATAAPWGWLGFLTPAFLLALLFQVTGIPANEEQNLRSRGDDYRRYQQETSVFVPWFPRRAAT